MAAEGPSLPPPEEPPRRRAADHTEESRLRRIIDRLADGVVVVDGDGVIRFANPAAEALFGRSAQELAGSPFGHPVGGDAAEIEVLRRGGGVLTAELRVVEIEWDGRPMRLVSLRDQTDRRHAAERERQLLRERAGRAQAEAASQAKSDFLAMMSHELRTPLNAVLGYSELLELGVAGPMTATQREHVERIQSSGRHLLGLVNEVLDLARVEAGQLTVRPAAAPAADAVAAALALIRPQAASRGLALADEPGAGPPAVYLGDEGRVRQVLVNLLSNAVKFTPAGGRVSIASGTTAEAGESARVQGPGPWTYFRVSDTGIGIEPGKMEAIFDPFVQAEAGHTRSRDGSGLGLTISRRLARLMGGDLVADSTPGRGSTFTLWLPAARGRPAALPHPAAGPAPSPPVDGLADAGRALLRESESILDELVHRLRTDPAVPGARRLPFSHLADHTGCMLADFAHSLIILEDTGGQPSAGTADSSDIQRLIAERHGVQRAGLGWTEPVLHREFEIVREEVGRALRRALDATGADGQEHALTVVAGLIAQAEHGSLRALRSGASA